MTVLPKKKIKMKTFKMKVKIVTIIIVKRITILMMIVQEQKVHEEARKQVTVNLIKKDRNKRKKGKNINQKK